MPILIPEKPAFNADRGAERKVWQALAAQLPEDAVLIHGLRLTRRSRDREGDLVVLWPGNGVAVIEVKGGHMSPTADGKFKQSNAEGRSKIVDPIEQARELMYLLKEWISANTSISTSYNFVFMAALPFADINTDWHSTRATRHQLIDKRDLVNAAGKVRAALEDNGGRVVVPDAHTITQMLAALQTKVKDAHDPVQLASLLDERSAFVQSLLEANDAKLDFVSEVPRFAVRGPAGSGKTAMAVNLAHRLVAKGQRVLYLCYSTLLSADLKRRDEALDSRKSRISAINTLHSLGPHYGIRVPSEVPDDYWEIQSPALIRAAAEQLPIDQKFDAVIVDEAQDFAPAWWDTVIALLRDPVNGGLFTFGDVGQTLFSRGGEQELGLVPLTLETNLRNTREISDGANRLTKSSVKCIGPEGPAIHFCEVPEWADVTVAGDAMASSMLNHYRPTDIALLHTHHRHPVHKEWERIGRAFYNKQYWEGDDIFYSTVMKFKGLERHCVVLVVDGFKDESRARELLYVGMTRAQDFLVVVSKRSTLSQFIDDDLMELLDENPIYLGDDIYQDDETDDDTDSET